MEVNKVIKENKDGGETRPGVLEVPSIGEEPKQKLADTDVKKKRRRGKSKRKITKPFSKVPWPSRRRNENCKRNNRIRKLMLTKSHAPYNNNQFLMEIHKPEPENNFQILETPARTRDSSFSVESDENYYYSLPEDEEEFLTKEFSSVYEDAQKERLTAMSKNELIQEFLLMEAKYETLKETVKRTERSKVAICDDKDSSFTDKETDVSTDRDTTGTSVELSMTDEVSLKEVVQRLKEQDDQIRELKLTNEKLRLENEHLSQRSSRSSSEDSESDSCSTSVSGSSSSSSRSVSPVMEIFNEMTDTNTDVKVNGMNGVEVDSVAEFPLVNGFHNGSVSPCDDGQME